jgi:hypothetical protein
MCEVASFQQWYLLCRQRDKERLNTMVRDMLVTASSTCFVQSMTRAPLIWSGSFSGSTLGMFFVVASSGPLYFSFDWISYFERFSYLLCICSWAPKRLVWRIVILHHSFLCNLYNFSIMYIFSYLESREEVRKYRDDLIFFDYVKYKSTT